MKDKYPPMDVHRNLSINMNKTIKGFQTLQNILGLFIPMPICPYHSIFTIKGYGFGYSISFGQYIPIGWIMIITSLIF